MKVIKEELIGIVADDGESYLNQRRLQSIAARQAAFVLASNWEVAVREGYDLDEIVDDVDMVIEELIGWRRLIRAAIRAKRFEETES